MTMSNSLTLPKDSMLRTFGDLIQMSDMLVKSGMIPPTVKTKEAAAAIILKGRELGIPTMEAFSLINVISGKPTISPQGMIALARRTGQLQDITITDETDTAVVTVTRKGQTPFTTRFSARDAVAMGLANKDNWQKQPKVMRQWRAISANFRITFPDVIGGMYMPEELGADVNDEGEVIQFTETHVPRDFADDQARGAFVEGYQKGLIDAEPALVPGSSPLPPAVNAHNLSGEPEPTEYNATTFWSKVRVLGVNGEAKGIFARHTTGKVTDWKAAYTELVAIGTPPTE